LLLYSEGEILPSKHDNIIFGSDNQLKVLGYCGSDSFGHRYLICKCAICEEDPELFGKGLFKITYNNIALGNMPCGCSVRKNWNLEQQIVRVNRACQAKGYSFIGFAEPFHGDKTRLELNCKDHGSWTTTTINKLFQNRGCPKCATVNNGLKKRIPDTDVLNSFFATESFPSGTLFTRSERKTNQGVQSYWNVYCPVCRTTNEAWVGNLQKGSMPCECGKNRQKEAYVNIIFDNSLPIALKFGVSRNSILRLYSINHNSIHQIENIAIYEFNSISDARKAEIECKYSFTCGIIPKTEMRDGYSETTGLENLESILSIYEKFGGKRIK